MLRETKTPPEIAPDDLVQFVESHRPKMDAGDYKAQVFQSFQIDETATKPTLDITSGELDFSVAGERFTLAEDNFHALFPPPGGSGKFGHTLPHVVFKRSTLPWERTPSADEGDALDVPVWLALLVFTKEEKARVKVAKTTAGQLLSTQGVSGAGTRDAGLGESVRTLFPSNMVLESAQHVQDPVSVIDVPWDLLKSLLPRYRDLGISAHVRRVGRPSGQNDGTEALQILPAETKAQADPAASSPANLADKAPAPDWNAISPELALIVGNRLVPVGEDCCVHLVSLEKRYKTPKLLVDENLAGLLRPSIRVTHPLLVELLGAVAPLHSIRLEPGKPPVLEPPNGDGEASFLNSTELDASSMDEICDALFDGAQSCWRDQQEQLGAVTFTAPIELNGAVPEDFEIKVFGSGQRAVDLDDDEILDVISQIPPVTGQFGHDIQLNLGGAETGLLDETAQNRLRDWIVLHAKSQFLAENKSILHTKSEAELEPISDLSLTELLSRRHHEILAKATIEDRDLEQLSAQDDARPKGWLGDVPSIKITLRAFELTVQLETGDEDTGIKATVKRVARSRGAALRRIGPEPIFDAEGATDDDNIRLVSLKSWEFDCLEDGGFREEIEKLNDANQQSAEFHIPIPPAIKVAENQEHHKVFEEGRNYLGAGAVALRHSLRNGDRTFSWYHGPFVTSANAGTKLKLPAAGPDELFIYNTKLAMFDASYAAAWQLGRLTMLEDTQIAMSFYQWKRNHGRNLAHLRQSLDHDFLPLVQNKTSDTSPPEPIADWFRSLTLLEDVPFNYLVPDEQFLPPDSIRFFSLDPMWLECLRDGAFSVGRVLDKDHVEDGELSQLLDGAPRLCGFLLRSKLVADWPHLNIEGYTGITRTENALKEPHPTSAKLKLERLARLSPNVLLCLFSDLQRLGREVEMVDLHLPAETLHFGLEGQNGADVFKQLRDPQTGKELTLLSWCGASKGAAMAEPIYRFDLMTFEALRLAGVAPDTIEKLKTVRGTPVVGAIPPEAGLSAQQLQAALPGDASETVQDLILRLSGPYENRALSRIQDMPFRPDGAEQVVDLEMLFFEVTNRMAQSFHPAHRFSPADFAMQMLDVLPLARIVRPRRAEGG